MLFNSFSFLIGFVLLLMIDRRVVQTSRVRCWSLLILSYGFYASWSLWYLPFLFASTCVDYVVAARIAHSRRPSSRRGWLALSLSANLGLLFWFKYRGFAQELVADVLGDPALHTNSSESMFVPLGISFFTLQTLSYTIDVYRGGQRPAKSLVEFMVFVAFFPQLVAGPIVRASELLPQLSRLRRATSLQLHHGLAMIVMGTFLKVVFADHVFRPLVELSFERDVSTSSLLELWLAPFFFTAQVYGDFAGYSLIAIGLASCLGVQLPTNFDSPFAADSFGQLWRRWHITLSRWFTDYLYGTPGGNRSSTRRRVANATVVMLVSGLWHGASWNFLLWGLIHAVFLGVEKTVSRRPLPSPQLANRPRFRIPSWCRRLWVFGVFSLTTVPFRSHGIEHLQAYVAHMFYVPSAAAGNWSMTHCCVAAFTLFACVAAHWRLRDISLISWFDAQPTRPRIVGLGIMIVVSFLCIRDPTAYVYFQF